MVGFHEPKGQLESFPETSGCLRRQSSEQGLRKTKSAETHTNNACIVQCIHHHIEPWWIFMDALLSGFVFWHVMDHSASMCIRRSQTILFVSCTATLRAGRGKTWNGRIKPALNYRKISRPCNRLQRWHLARASEEILKLLKDIQTLHSFCSPLMKSLGYS